MGGVFQFEGGVWADAIGAVEHAASAEAPSRARANGLALSERFFVEVLSETPSGERGAHD
jgi:hypothetical protein